MENELKRPTSAEASAALAAAEESRAAIAQGIVLPTRFLTSIGAAIAVQIATTAIAIGANVLWPLAAGLLIFAAVAAVQLHRFRRLNGARLGGLASRVVLGTATGASVAYAGALAAGIWAAGEALWWLVALCSLAGGAAYAVSGRRWMHAYRADPSGQARGVAPVQLALLALVTLACLLGLVLAR